MAPHLIDPAVALVASVLMVLAALRKRRFTWRDTECRVCHHPKGACTCRWL